MKTTANEDGLYGAGQNWASRASSIDDALSSPVHPSLIEFPADDPERARRFWSGVLGTDLQPRREEQGAGWQTETEPAIGVHERGRGPGDSFSLAYFTVPNMAGALQRVVEHGGVVVHPGEKWAICRDSEGSPFALAASDRHS